MSTSGLTGRDLRLAILFAALVYLAIRFINHIADILLIFSVSALIAIALNPAAGWLQKHKIPRTASAGLLALLVLALPVLVGYLVIPRAAAQVSDLASQAPEYVSKAQDWLQQRGFDKYLPEQIQTSDLGGISGISRQVIRGATRVTTSVVGALAAAFLAFMTTIYLIANPKPIADGLLRAVAPEHRKRAQAAGEDLAVQIRAWAIGILIGMFFIFLVTWIALSLIGVKQAFLFAVIAGLLEAVPVLGPVISAIPPIVVSLLSGNPVTALWVALAFLAIQQIEGNLLIPLIMSRQLSLHPVTVIFSVLVMGGLFGIVGIFLAAPAAVTAGIIWRDFYIRVREGDVEA